MEYVASIAGTDNFLSHTHSSATSYFACSNNKVYSISHNDVPSTYINNGYLITKKWTGNGIHTKKSIGYMYAWYILPSSSYSIKIYARKDNWSFRLLKTITDNTQRWVMITASEFSAVDLWDLYELQLKFELIWPANPTDTPLLWEVLVFCNDNYNK